ncbi:hypothetical protein L1987_20965 [Smallanthus sonchifolius]|uniref:Uncharacterized protein n=1 Tax=Smallanthus sonchifolius TaxID=185202 RepID=A0ACB9IUY8_9ASTR|nr:hypothetical protein L1987_20965 [Smallanthus sonchifolius]
MAYDQNALPNRLRPIHIARTPADESRIVNLPNSNPLPREVATGTGSPGTIPVYYPSTAPAVPDSGYVGLSYGNVVPAVVNWLPRVPPPAKATAAGVGLVPGYAYTNSTGLAPSGYNPNLAPSGGSNASDHASDESGGDDSVSGRKVKFLCSYGGKILPRPSDGVLRYVGGDTRIISVRRDVGFNELMQKMFDSNGRNVVIKYQLPGEDLDALVTVSRPDDLENMMDEYDKLIERSSDGSAKLRVFLFSDLDSSSVIRFKDLQDSGQKYVEAVNGIGDSFSGGGSSGVGGGGRKGSIASASSTQNSEVSGTEGGADNIGHDQGEVIGPAFGGVGGVLSPGGSSATGVSNTKPISVPASPSQSDHESEILERTVPVHVQQQGQFGYDLQPPGATIQPPAPYVQAYVDPRHGTFSRTEYIQMPPPQMGYQSQIMGSIGPVYAQPQLHNNVIGIGVTPQQFITPSSHVSFSPNPNSNPVPVPVPIPVPVPASAQAQAPVPVPAQAPVSVPVQPPAPAPPQYVQPRDVVMEHYPERVVHVACDPSYSTYQPQTQIPPPVIPGTYGWNQIPGPEQVPFSESRVPTQQLIYPEPVPRFDGCIMCQKALPHAHSDTVAQDRRESPRSTVSDVNPVYQSLKYEDTRRIMQTNRVPASDPTIQVSTPYGVLVQQSAVPMQYQANQEPMVDKLVSGESNPVGVPSPTSDTQAYESPREYPVNFPSIVTKEDNVESGCTYDNLRQIEARMEDLRLRPHDVLVNTDQSSFRVKNPQDEILENRPMNLDKSQMVVDPNYIVSEVSWLHGFQSMASGGTINLGGNDTSPAFSGGDSARVTEGNPPVSDWNAYPVQFDPKSEVKTVLIDPLNPFNGVVVETQDGANSLFSNQDPWMLRHDSQFPPPRPNKLMPKKEAVGAKEESPTADTLIDDGPYQTNANLDLNFGVEQGSAEELIKQELQAVAEGVAASVLRSSTPSHPDLNKHSSEAKQSGEAQSNADVQPGVEAEDLKTKIPEKTNHGFPVSDGLGPLQIIKNSDLEELRELGSGTFGTVYHGKWRGSDVAIKRINDRCFAGKASEQERMREDFWNEAKKLADLHHPNVVAFYGVVLDGPGGSFATVTEYMVNGSLRTALQKNERNLDKRKRLLIAMDVAFGMEYLHGKNIVHFDLKSDNLLVNLRDPHRPICKVGDLGLSKVKRQTLISGGVRGTLPWMAPELLNGSSSLVSEKVDVFSFGIVMWELLTGDEPYADLHYGAIIGGIVSNTLRPPVPESCDPEWRSLMERCWSSEPSERPSFTDIANQLRTITSKVPSKVQPYQ